MNINKYVILLDFFFHSSLRSVFPYVNIISSREVVVSSCGFRSELSLFVLRPKPHAPSCLLNVDAGVFISLWQHQSKVGRWRRQEKSSVLCCRELTRARNSCNRWIWVGLYGQPKCRQTTDQRVLIKYRKKLWPAFPRLLTATNGCSRTNIHTDFTGLSPDKCDFHRRVTATIIDVFLAASPLLLAKQNTLLHVLAQWRVRTLGGCAARTKESESQPESSRAVQPAQQPDNFYRARGPNSFTIVTACVCLTELTMAVVWEVKWMRNFCIATKIEEGRFLPLPPNLQNWIQLTHFIAWKKLMKHWNHAQFHLTRDFLNDCRLERFN